MKILLTSIVMAISFAGVVALACDCDKGKGAKHSCESHKKDGKSCGKEGESCECKDCECGKHAKADKAAGKSEAPKTDAKPATKSN